MVSILWLAMASMWFLLSRIARIPPCTPGCRVFTRPATPHKLSWEHGTRIASRQPDIQHIHNLPCCRNQLFECVHDLVSPDTTKQLTCTIIPQWLPFVVCYSCKPDPNTPSSISGNPVTSSTFLTGTPMFWMAVAVPPVEMISKPCSCRPCAPHTCRGSVPHLML